MMLAFLLIAAVSAADLEKSCNAGKAAACDELGTRFRDGFGVRRNEVRAAQLFRKACQGKDNDGCADEARAMALAEGQNGDPRKALPRLEQLCKAGRARACGHLGEIYLRGLGSPQDAGRAEDLLLKGCDKGWGRACTNLSYLNLKANQRERAEELALRACELEDPSGCAYAGDIYATSHDTVRASLYFARACDAGSARGCAGQGYLLVDSGVDAERGRQLLQKGCDGGEVKACNALKELK